MISKKRNNSREKAIQSEKTIYNFYVFINLQLIFNLKKKKRMKL